MDPFRPFTSYGCQFSREDILAVFRRMFAAQKTRITRAQEIGQSGNMTRVRMNRWHLGAYLSVQCEIPLRYVRYVPLRTLAADRLIARLKKDNIVKTNYHGEWTLTQLGMDELREAGLKMEEVKAV